MPIPIPENEAERLRALNRYSILDTPPEEAFDRITRLLAAYVDVPIALISLVDDTRQWFKSRYGLEAEETPREVAFCAHAIMDVGPLVVTDATQDPRFSSNPLVTGAPDIRFYAGAPLRTSDGHNLGTLCAIDREPRELSERDRSVLADLASLVIDQMEFRLASQKLITEIEVRKRAEAVATENEKRFRDFAESSADRFWETDVDLRFTFLSDPHGDAAHPRPEVLHGQTRWQSVGVDPDDDPVWGRHRDDMLARRPFRDFRYTFETESGEVSHWDVSGIPAFDADNRFTGYRGTATNVTALVEAEQLRDEFVSTVSHELRTPLTSIKGSLGLVRAGATGHISDKLKSMVDIAYRNSERLVALVNDILDIEKIEAGKMDYAMDPVDLTELVTTSIEANAAFAAEHDVTFEFEGVAGPCEVRGDRQRLDQVMANLLSNAVKFSHPGGVVTVGVASEGATARISVTDRGVGIPDDFRGRIFEKFAQADSSDTREKGGTGLGLSITKSIVDAHGGWIDFDSAPGAGTTFRVELPLPRRLSNQLGDNNRKVLVCEDDLDIGRVLVDILQRAGIAADLTTTAIETRERLKIGSYAAMTLDIGLPDGDGISLLRDLRQDPQFARLPIIVVSAASRGDHDLNGGALPIVDWIEKPIDEPRLIGALDLAIADSASRLVRILHVEDDDDVVHILTEITKNMAAEITQARTVAEAGELLQQVPFDLIVLDLALDDGENGADVLPLAKRRDGEPIPIIVFSANPPPPHLTDQVAASIEKTRISNEGLLEIVNAVIDTKN